LNVNKIFIFCFSLESPIDVGVSMYILSLHSFSESDMEFTSDFYFRQFWNDPRLVFRKTSNFESFTSGTELSRSIWVPDTFFVNERESFVHSASTKNEFVKISHNGDVVRSIRLSVTFSCLMDFRNFPLDTQKCSIPLESCKLT
jgi:glycine receptor alpha-3